MVRIQHLQWLGFGVAAIGCLTLGGAATVNSARDYLRYAHGTDELAFFVTVLDAANAISAERGPANATMGAQPDEQAASFANLAQKREITDRSLSAVDAGTQIHSAEPHQEPGLTLDTDLAAIRNSLADARAEVDRVARQLPEERAPGAVPHAINAMFGVADQAATLRSLVASHIFKDTPEAAGGIILASDASALREYEGRLGSYVVMMLTSPPDADPEYLSQAQQTRTVLHNIWSTGLSGAASLFDDESLRELARKVDEDFFDGAMPMAMDVATWQGFSNTMTAAEFTDRYVPGMASSEVLRNHIIEHAAKQLSTSRDAALRATTVAMTLTTLILVVLALVGIIFRRALFHPLMVVQQQVAAVASGDLHEPERPEKIGPEVRNILDGLAVLRQQQRDKHALELEQLRLNQQLKRLSETDTLTGLLNRRALLQRANAVFARAAKTGENLGLILFDLDHFKAVNDNHGHAVGDEVLIGATRLLSSTLRPTDVMARIGGEEFVVLLRHTSADETRHIAETMRARLATIPIQQPLALKVTGSFGVAMRYAEDGHDWDHVFSQADARLYAAKRQGRNTVVDTGHSAPWLQSTG